MSFFDSIFGGKDKTTSQTSDPWQNMPDWLKEAYQDSADRGADIYDDSERIAAAMNDNPRKIAPVNINEKRAVSGVLKENQQAQRLYDKSADLDGLREMYEDPWMEDVVGTTLAGMDRYQDREQSQRATMEASIGGPNNTRMAVADALAQQLGGMDRASMEAKLRSEGFTTAAGLGLQASGRLEALGTAGLSAQELASRYQGTLGETERLRAQQQLDANRNSGQEANSWLAQIHNATSPGRAPTGVVTTGSQPGPGTGQQILGTAATAAGIWAALSDENAKEDIKLDESSGLEKLAKVPSYEYKYKAGLGHKGEARTAGILAQDLENAGIMGAVHERADGLKEVDALPVLSTVIQAVRELDVRTRSAGLT